MIIVFVDLQYRLLSLDHFNDNFVSCFIFKPLPSIVLLVKLVLIGLLRGGLSALLRYRADSRRCGYRMFLLLPGGQECQYHGLL